MQLGQSQPAFANWTVTSAERSIMHVMYRM